MFHVKHYFYDYDVSRETSVNKSASLVDIRKNLQNPKKTIFYKAIFNLKK